MNTLRFLNHSKRRLCLLLGSDFQPRAFLLDSLTSYRLKSDVINDQTKVTGNKSDAETKARVETARTVSNWLMFPWERRQMDGENVPLRTWEKIYWWIFVGGLSLLLFSWIQRSSAAKDKPQVDEELEAKKLEMARAILAGKSLATGSDPFEGFSPRQIEEFVESKTGASAEDPYEGMSPEEIDTYVAKHGT